VIHGGVNALRFTPHFLITSEEIDMIVSLVESCLRSFVEDDHVPAEGILAN
jgi:acetylornithine/succinyldiaminopimelate/putrescine aminotransferase